MGERGQSEAAEAAEAVASGAAAAFRAEGETGGLDGLTAEIRALRQEIRDLRVLVLQLAGGQARRQAERLAGEVQRRQALGGDPGKDPELDLLIDRLHDLALEGQP